MAAKAGLKPEWIAEITGQRVAMMDRVLPLAGGGFVFAGSLEEQADAGGTLLKPPEGSYGGHFVGRLDAKGNIVWVKVVGPAIQAREGLAVDPLGNILVGGTFMCNGRVWTVGPDTMVGKDCGNSYYVAKLAPDGKILWARNWTSAKGPTPRDASMDALAVDTDGSVYVSGAVTDELLEPSIPNMQSAMFIAKFDPAGKPIWRRQLICDIEIKSDAFKSERPSLRSLAVDAQGNIHAAGSFRDRIHFQRNGASFDDSLVSLGREDICLFSFTKFGALRFAKRAGGREADVATLLRPMEGGFAVSGELEGEGEFENLGAEPFNLTAAFLARFDSDGRLLGYAKMPATIEEVNGFAYKDEIFHMLAGSYCPGPTESCGVGPKEHHLIKADKLGRVLSQTRLPDSLSGNPSGLSGIELRSFALSDDGLPVLGGARIRPLENWHQWNAFVLVLDEFPGPARVMPGEFRLGRRPASHASRNLLGRRIRPPESWGIPP